MSISTLIRTEGTPWDSLGTRYSRKIVDPHEIVEEAKLNWEVAHEPMYTEKFGQDQRYWTVYRTDNNKVLGVVNTRSPLITQNIEMFNSLKPILTDGTIDLDTTARFGNTDMVFGTFKLSEKFDILGDAIDHYLVVINDHLKPDGRIMVINTPVRVACSNAIGSALSKNLYSMRIPVSSYLTANNDHAGHIIMEAQNAIRHLQSKADKMAMQKLSDLQMDKVIDFILPYPELDGVTEVSTQKGEEVEMMREIFTHEYLNSDNLQNFKYTNWGVYQAVVDFSQHAWKKVDTAYNLDSRMKKIPGLGEKTLDQKYLAFQKDLLAA